MLNKYKDTKKPNLFVIGAIRAGTTFLYQVLGSHPAIAMSIVKEPRYFVPRISGTCNNSKISLNINKNISDRAEFIHKYPVSDEETYLRLFADTSAQYRGEASPQYLTEPLSLESIATFCDDPKIIMSLRDPAERAYSHCSGDHAKGLFKADPRTRLLHDLRLARSRGIEQSEYIKHSLYHVGLVKAVELFGDENVEILIFERWVSHKKQLISRLSSFLGIEETGFEINIKNKNTGLAPRLKYLNHGFSKYGLKNVVRRLFPARLKRLGKKIYYGKRMTEIDKDLHFAINHLVLESIECIEGHIGDEISEWKYR